MKRIFVSFLLALFANPSAFARELSFGTDYSHSKKDRLPYSLYGPNCHTAANGCVQESPDNTRIIACLGDVFDPRTSPAGHTFNCREEQGYSVYLNWGQECTSDGPCSDVSPCAKMICEQARQVLPEHDPVILEPGELVEDPTPYYCADNTSSRESCDTCCRERGNFWDRLPMTDPFRPTNEEFRNFMSQCFTSCSAQFPTIIRLGNPQGFR